MHLLHAVSRIYLGELLVVSSNTVNNTDHAAITRLISVILSIELPENRCAQRHNYVRESLRAGLKRVIDPQSIVYGHWSFQRAMAC
jgi:hypothetical protein